MVETPANADWRALPVWRCQHVDTCGEQWASMEGGISCPFCHGGPGEATGFTCGDVADAEAKYGFSGKFPVHVQPPPPQLIQLTELPQELWVGLPVFHPCGQEGNLANWLLYDVGVVVEVTPDRDFPTEFQCRFITSSGGQSFTLTYAPSNLWVPRILAERLL